MTPPVAASFLWHDYETFGADPRRDRASEFACWRSNAEFEPIADPIIIRCQPTLDYLPEIEACKITGIGPEAALRDGLPEYEFADRVQAQMAQAQSCSVGYNSMRFDDEISRHLFWRNFVDPYEREWARGNSRFDLIDLARACRALRPEGIEWPSRDDGKPSFKLTDLSQANALPHQHAHSALSDVEATMALARLIRRKQPRLLDYALDLRRKSRVLEMLDWRQRKPVIHVSQRFPAERGCLALVVPLALHPNQSGKVIVIDAFHDPEPVLTWPVARLSEMLVAPADRPDRVALGIKLVHANRAPFLAPPSVLNGVDLARIQFDRARIEANALRLREAPGLDARVQQIHALLEQSPRAPQDADTGLYDGFVGDQDRALCRRFRLAGAAQLAELATRFNDERLRTLAFRFRARHFEPTLSSAEKSLWIEHCKAELRRPERSVSQFELAATELSDSRPELAADLLQWAGRVRQHAGLPP
jgi:exodeoxyribonuclease I